MMSKYKQNKMVGRIEGVRMRVRKTLKSLRLPFMLFCILSGIALTGYSFYKISTWYDAHRVVFQYPVLIKFQSPIEVKKREVISPLPAGAPVKKTQTKHMVPVEGSFNEDTGVVTAGMTHGQMALEAYKTVRFHESTNGALTGLNGYCHKLGRINEVGYDPQHNFCFANETEQIATVVNWYRNCLQKSAMSVCLGTYSSNSYTQIYYE